MHEDSNLPILREDHSPAVPLTIVARPIFQRWERLRPLYNVFLATVWMLTHGRALGLGALRPEMMLLWLVGAVGANLCFLAGPLTESYLAWLGLKPRLLRLGLFVGGLVLSAPLVAFFR